MVFKEESNGLVGGEKVVEVESVKACCIGSWPMLEELKVFKPGSKLSIFTFSLVVFLRKWHPTCSKMLVAVYTAGVYYNYLLAYDRYLRGT